MSKITNKTFHIVVIGCQMNKSDSERISGYMELLGFKKTSREKAGFVFITTCGVRQSAEDRIYGLVPNIKKENPKVKIILTGCLSERDDVKKRLKGKVDMWMPIADLPDLARKIGVRQKESGYKNYLNVLPKYSSKFTAFVPIGNGCDNFCTYCVVPYARGREVYRAADEIVEEVKGLVEKGFREVNLIAQNVNSYVSGDDKKINFSKLLEMINRIEGDFWIRFATSHPKDMSDELIKVIAKNEKMCKHVHLPVQSGDDEILRRMNRKYTSVHYLGLIEKIRKNIPGVSITTDTIVGFPGETKAQFNNTAKLYKKVKYDMAYIAQFSPRFGTAAASLKDDVSKIEKKRREGELMEILRKTALENNKKYIGKEVQVLIWGKNKKGELSGYTGTNKMVKLKIKNQKLKIGEGGFVKVKITEVEDFGLRGEIL